MSGGSITAGVLELGWSGLGFDGADVADNFEAVVVTPLRAFAGKTIDVPAVLLGAVTPGITISDMLARGYRRLFGKRPLVELPKRPEFVFDATSLQSGDLWRFSNLAEGDWRVGSRATPDTAAGQCRCRLIGVPLDPVTSQQVLISDARGHMGNVAKPKASGRCRCSGSCRSSTPGA